MHISDAQREVRTVFLGGFAGMLVSGSIWLVSAALGTWSTHRNAIIMLAGGGAFIFPLSQLVLKAMGGRATLSSENPMGQLATQVAITIPLSLPIIAAATLHHVEWFYPAFLVVVGAHYFPFMFLYGMWTYLILASVLILGGVAIGITQIHSFAAGGWFGGAVLLLSAFPFRLIAKRQDTAVGNTGTA